MLDRAAALIAVRSTADRPDERARALHLVLGGLGPGFTVRHFRSAGVPSALVHTGPPREDFRVVLNAHLDVVPGTDDQFTARRVGDRLYGRGAHDMKVAALVLAEVFREQAAALPYPLALQLVTDEEVGGADGTGHQVAAGLTADVVVIGEQSRLRVVTESKSLCQARLTAVGEAAHAAYPWLGRNALTAVTGGVGRVLARYPVPAAEAWTTTVNVARIATGNRAVNQVPADATAWLDIRFPPDDPDLAGRTREQVAAYLGALAGLPAEVDALAPPHRADPGSAAVTLLRRAAADAGFPGELLRKHGAADGRWWSARGVDAVIFGPGGAGQHGPDEYADVSTLLPYHAALTAFLKGMIDA